MGKGMTKDVGALFVCLYPHDVVFYFDVARNRACCGFVYLKELSVGLIEGSSIVLGCSMPLCIHTPRYPVEPIHQHYYKSCYSMHIG
jgi:hypothetical protein